MEKKFEEKMSELEVLVKSLENGDIALDDAIKSFTEAMNLAKDCDKELKDAEKALNVSHGWLSKAARQNKIAYGFRWKFL